MNKADLLRDLDEEYRQWEALLADIGEDRMERPGVAGHWSIKDIVAHIAGWRRRTVQRLQAEATGQPLPPPPWPAELNDDDIINAWLYEREHGKPVKQVLEESDEVFRQMRAAVEAIPDAYFSEPGHFAWLEGAPLAAATFFSHYHDEHEAGMRLWLAGQDNA